MDYQISSHCPRCGCHCRGFSTVRISVAEMKSYHNFLEACQGAESDQRHRRFFSSASREAKDTVLIHKFGDVIFSKNKKTKILLWWFYWRWASGSCILWLCGADITWCWWLWRCRGIDVFFRTFIIFLFHKVSAKIYSAFFCCLISLRDLFSLGNEGGTPRTPDLCVIKVKTQHVLWPPLHVLRHTQTHKQFRG